ncbi:hypothetical protein [Rhizobium rhizoryzae]|uniref:hypothetical protein n=1 Tax=Rhizobium rhizoryzae TaxID=451876 RepID=UPI0028975010|nr:hypothetical protein [Rhizobium rhizoryzae]
MAISLKHKKNVSIADDPAAAAAGQVVSSNWNDEHDLLMATARLLGRVTAGTGVAEELTAAQVLALLGVAAGATANQTDSYLLSRANHTGTQAQSTITNLTADLAARLLLSGGTMTGALTLSADPASALQAATKQYVDGLLLNMGRRSRVRVATTGNITITTALNSGDVIDGVTLANGDLVLVKDQTTASQNGVYVVSASPARSTEFDAWDEFPGALIGVAEGTLNDNTLWFCTSNTGGTIGTTAITFTQFRVAGELLAANNLSDLANAATARINLGLAIGTNVQAWSQKLADIAGSTPAIGDTLVWDGSNFVPQASSGGGMSLPGGMTKDPRLLPVYDATGGVNVYVGTTSTSMNTVNLDFWNQVALIGAVSSTATSNVYTTLCNITGAGILFHVISPAIANVTDDVFFKITVDGTVYEIIKTNTWGIANATTSRVVFGSASSGSVASSLWATAAAMVTDYAGSAQSVQAFRKATSSVFLNPPSHIMTFGWPCLRFEQSLKVEVKVSNIASAGNSAYCAATYILD